MDNSRNQYWKSVQTLAEEVDRAVRNGRELDEAVRENVDGSQWVFKYGKSIRTILHSDNEPDRLWKQAEDWREAITHMAYECMVQDVRQAVTD